MTQLGFPMGPESVAIIGSREFPYPQLVTEYVNREVAAGAVVVSGGARGPDRAAERAAEARDDLPEPRIYRAQWRRPDGSTDGAAGFRRNRVIARACDRLVAFWFDGSAGTGHTVGLVQGMGKPVELWYAVLAPPGPWSFGGPVEEYYAKFGMGGFTIHKRDSHTGEWAEHQQWWDKKTQEA